MVANVEEAVKIMHEDDFSQPIKPYLRYKDQKNRIIAMPAYIGGLINKSGIKWISSFPDNINYNKPRAHSVLILNNAETGEPISIINGALLSIYRTVAVSALVAKYVDIVREFSNFNLGIIGFGPIGQNHLKCFEDLYNEKINNIMIYDKKTINNDLLKTNHKINVCSSWQEVYKNSDILITCTVSDKRYINLSPKKGSLHLNVSLRDYEPSIYDHMKDSIIVDNWEEVCRENTDIEIMHKQKGLKKSDTYSINDVVLKNAIRNIPLENSIMFNPMGMSIFDITIGSYYYTKALDNNIGIRLD
nr:2,3-diaminopropionate biosynthesis protein SbnB [Bacillus alkalicellulosilyticus]